MPSLEAPENASPQATPTPSERAVLRYMSEGCLTLSPNWTVLYHNPAAARHWGGSEQDFVGWPLTEAFPTIDPRMLDQLARCMAEGAPAATEVRLPRADATQAWFRLRVQPIPEGLLVLSTDVTPIKQAVASDMVPCRQAEMDVAETSACFQAAFDQASIGRTLTRPDGRLDRVNRTLCEMLGYSPEELAAKSFAEITHPDDLEESQTCVRALLAGEVSSYRLQKRYIHKDGRIVWTNVSTAIARDEHGQPQHFITDVIDVTERQEHLTQIARNEARLRSLLAISQCSAKDAQGLLEFALIEALPLTGSSLGYFCVCDEVRGDLALKAWVRNAEARPVPEPLPRCAFDENTPWGNVVWRKQVLILNEPEPMLPLAGGLPDELELTRLLVVPVVDGERVVAVAAVANKETAYDEADAMQLTLLMGTASREVSRLEAEIALRTSEAKARAMYERLPIPTFVWQRREEDFVLVDFNLAAAEITADEVKTWVGQPLQRVHANCPAIIHDIERCFTRQASFQRERSYTFPGSSNERVLVFTYGFAPSDMVLVHAEDLTERRRTKEQLDMSQRLEAIGQLAGGVAHDFNNLLLVINGNTDLALEDLADADPIREDLLEVRRAGQRARLLTNQLLAFSRKQVLAPKILNLNDVIGGLEAMLRRLLGEDIIIVIHMAESLGNVLADPGQVEQVLVNLAVNARDAMPLGGSLVIETRNVDVHGESGDGPEDLMGPHVELTVSDTGDGMAETVLRRIFEPFFTTKPKGKGTGLGLATVYGIIRQSGGHVSASSAIGEGTTFRILLPRAEGDAEYEPAPDSERAGGTELILVVEDEEAVRKLAQRVLHRAGYQVLTAANGGEALLLCEEHGAAIRLLISDVVMPQMSGVRLSERLRQLVPDLCVLFMSGYPDEALGRHGVLEPGIFLLPKPFTGKDLTKKVREVLDGRPRLLAERHG